MAATHVALAIKVYSVYSTLSTAYWVYNYGSKAYGYLKIFGCFIPERKVAFPVNGSNGKAICLKQCKCQECINMIEMTRIIEIKEVENDFLEIDY